MDSLPLDLQFLIQSFLDPSDIVSLRMTCQSFYLASQQRTVWLAALQRVCIDHGALMISFPFEDMSVKELEHAALSPSRLVDRLRNGSSDKALEPQRILPFEPLDSEAQPYSFSWLYLIPGGRFLFTESARKGHIALWDLGNVGTREEMTWLPVAVIDDGRLVLMDACPTADETGLLLSTYYVLHPSSFDPWQCQVVTYEIYPSTPDPEFTPKGELNVNALIDISSNAGGCFVFLTEMDEIVLWNLATNDSITWEPSIIATIHKLFLMDHYLIILSSVDITMWEIPIFWKERCDGDLRSNSAADAFGPLQPKLKHSLKYPIFSEPAIFSLPSSWWPSSGDAAIGVSPEGNTSGDKMAFYILDSGPIPSWDRPRVRTVSFVGLTILSGRPHYLRLCNNNICQRWHSDGDDIVIGLMATPTQTNGFGSECMAITRSIFCGPTQDSDFCPISGRLVIITKDSRLCVMDFVAPPT